MKKIITALLLSITGSTIAQYNLNQGLTDRFRLNNSFYKEGSTSVAMVMGTGTTPQFVEDKWGNTNSAIRITSSSPSTGFGINSSLFCSNTFTISMNVKMSGTGYVGNYSYYPLILVRNDNPSYFERFIAGIRTSDNKLTAGLANGTNMKTVAETVDFNEWIHVAFVYNTNTVSMYINGVFIETTDAVNNVTCQSAFAAIGNLLFNTHQGHINADIDEIRLYNRVLNENEIHGIYVHDFENDNFTPGITEQNVHFSFTESSLEDEIEGLPLQNVTDVQFSTDRYNTENAALYLSGSHSQNLGLPNGIAASDDFTVSLYVKHEAGSTGSGLNFTPLVFIGNGNSSYFEKFSIGLDGNGVPNIYTAKPNSICRTTNTTILTVDRWYHLTGIYAQDSLRLYIDGVQVSAVANTISDMPFDPAQFIYIGAAGPTSNKRFIGSLDEIQIFSEVLTPAEILALVDYPEDNGEEDDNNNVAVQTADAKIIQLYPNPAKESITLKGDDLNKYKSIEVVDVLGSVVATYSVQSSTENIQLTGFKNGLYFVRLIGDTTKTIRFQIAK